MAFELTPRRHELLSVILLSIGTIVMFLGYDVQAVLAESVLHSVHSRYPERISVFAGYYGQALHYLSFAICSLFTAPLQYYLASRWMLALSGALFTAYFLGYFHIMLGFAYSLYNNGEGAYMSEHSSRRTIDSNSALETGIGHSSLLFGGVILFVILHIVPTSSDGAFRSFSDHSIMVIYGSMLVLSSISILIFAFLPTKQFDSIAQHSNTERPSIKEQFRRFCRVFKRLNTVLLFLPFAYMGLIVSFMYGIYPTSLSFNPLTAADPYNIAYYTMSAGCAAFTGAIVFRRLIKRLEKYKLVVPLVAHFLIVIAILALCWMSVPNEATIHPVKSGEFTLIKPSTTLICVIGYLMGLADFTITMVRITICQTAVPKFRAELFSVTRVYQCLSSCVILFLSPYFTLLTWTYVLGVGLLLGMSSLLIVVHRTPMKDAVPKRLHEVPYNSNIEKPPFNPLP
ncbi:hypothetical protein WR25_20850 [Diploscapter pachys]|uniref:Major facilitator superfamily associated domain-containing protein n=1 Tax=Diploscapter pachys TaxID=2018661 RepID=A0A2A2JPJ1_9BILA|nr:hypothetical protein WR25_20850 [Diploscapter pachys]